MVKSRVSERRHSLHAVCGSSFSRPEEIQRIIAGKSSQHRGDVRGNRNCTGTPVLARFRRVCQRRSAARVQCFRLSSRGREGVLRALLFLLSRRRASPGKRRGEGDVYACFASLTTFPPIHNPIRTLFEAFRAGAASDSRGTGVLAKWGSPKTQPRLRNRSKANDLAQLAMDKN
jgi:hypothetical protein